jgi:hypothetical protein
MSNSGFATDKSRREPSRLGTIIQRVQGYIQLMWKGRHQALHKCNKDDENKFLTLESAEIQRYFHQPHLLSVQDQHYCQRKCPQDPPRPTISSQTLAHESTLSSCSLT